MKSAIARGLLVVVVALLVGAAAYAFSENQPAEYQSTARLAYGSVSPELRVLGPSFGEPDVDEDIRIATEAARVNSFDIAEAAAKAAPELGYSAGQIAGLVEATPSRGTLVLLLTATGSTPRASERLARAYTNTYLKRVRTRERSGAAAVERALEVRLADLPRADRRSVRGAALRDQISAVNLLKRVGSGTPQVIQTATASGSPTQPKTQRNVIFGLLFGLAVGVGLVAMRSESRVRAAAAVRRGAGMRAEDEPGRTP